MKAHAYSVTRVQFSLVLSFRSGFRRGFCQPQSLSDSFSFFCCLSLSLALFLPSLSPFHEKGWLEMELNERRLDVLAIIASDIKLKCQR